MRAVGDFFYKAINEGFEVELEVNGEYAGMVGKEGDNIYMSVHNGRFCAIEKMYDDTLVFANNVEIKGNKIIVRG